MDANREKLRAEIDKWFEGHTDEMIEDLGRLIAIESVRGPEEEGAPFGPGPRKVLSVAGEMLQSRGLEVSEFENIIISADIGPAPPEMGILAHLDVVAAGEGWDTDPFSMTIKDGKVLGRGASDNKGPSIASMYAVYCARDICPQLKKGMRIILGSGEEMGCHDIEQYLEKIAPPPNVFTPDAAFPVVNIEKGRFLPFFKAAWDEDKTLPRVLSITGGKTTNIVPDRAEAVIEGLKLSDVIAACKKQSEATGVELTARELKAGETTDCSEKAPNEVTCDAGTGEVGVKILITASGKSAHAASAPIGNNAQTALIEMLAAMPFAPGEGQNRIMSLSRLFPHGDCSGKALGIAMNDAETGDLTVNFSVIAYDVFGVTGHFDSRTPGCADDVNLPELTRSKLASEGLEMTHSEITHCHHTHEDTPFIQALLRVYEEYTGDKGKCLSMGGTTYVHGIKGGVAFGCGMPGVDYLIHGANEFMDIDHLILSAKMFTQAILDMCG